MAYSLEGIKAKIRRADQNIQELDTKISSFLKEHYRFGSEFDVESRAYRFSAFGKPKLPETFSVLVGEILYQFRSALDHTVTQLTEIGPGGGKPERLEFPICDSPERFKEACDRGKIQGVSDAARKTIESFQPYITHSPKELAVLYWINELNRIDKHRISLTVAACVQMASAVNVKADLAIDFIGMDPPIPSGTRPTEEGAKVFRMYFGDAFDPNMNVEGDFTFQVSFDYPGVLENRPVVDVLVQMGQLTVLYIKQLCPDFVL